MNEIMLTVIGNVVSDVSLKHTASGVPVATFRLAANERRFDSTTGTWNDADTTYLQVTCWRSLAEHTAECLAKGAPVIVHGRVRTRTIERVVGEERIPVTYFNLEANHVGPDLARVKADLDRSQGAVAVTNQDLAAA